MSSSDRSPLASSPWLVSGILLIAANLRGPVTGVAPLLPQIQTTFGLDAGQAGMLTTLPLLAFALVSPLAAGLARRFGLERSLFGALVLITVGIAARSLGGLYGLYAGTALFGAGIAIGNVLLPSLVKRDFPGRVALLTSTYALIMGATGALASAIAVPVAGLFEQGWHLSLGGLILLPLITLVIWSRQLGQHTPPAGGTADAPHGGPVWRSPLAWQVTAFMGLNSLTYYSMVAWLPAILVDDGYSPATAGSLHGLMQLASAAPGLILAPLVSRLRDQRLLAAGTAALMLLGPIGLWLWPAGALLWSTSFGLGAGAGVILALMFMGLRSTTTAQAAALSGMAQCIGYLLASTGPFVMGVLHDWHGSWTLPLLLCTATATAMGLAGLFAGRDRHIGRHQDEAI